jgi:NitT/TauT family transport system permease protein
VSLTGVGRGGPRGSAAPASAPAAPGTGGAFGPAAGASGGDAPPTSAVPGVPRGARARRGGRRALGLVVPTVLVLLWALASERAWVNPVLVPSPMRVLESLVDFFGGEAPLRVPGVIPFTGAGWDHVAASLTRAGVSFAAAVAVGLSLGLALGLSRLVSDLLDPLVNGLRAVPLYAWLPLALVWFGIGENAARAIIFLGALWPVLIATADSVGRVPRAYIETARMLGTPSRRLWRRVYLPSALPEIVTGLRLSLTLAWMCVIVGELTGTTTGVGAMMTGARETGRIDQIVVGILVFAVIGFLADLLVRTLARPLVRWSLT